MGQDCSTDWPRCGRGGEQIPTDGSDATLFEILNRDDAKTLAMCLERNTFTVEVLNAVRPTDRFEQRSSSPLMFTLWNQKPLCLTVLLDSPAVNSSGRNRIQLTPLMVAAEVGDLYSCERLILEKDAAVNEVDMYSRTALMSACCSTHDKAPQIVKVLINSGAQINKVDAQGRSALMCGAESGATESVRALIGDYRPSKNEAEKAAYHVYSRQVPAEFSRSVQLDLQSHGGGTALMIAANSGHTELVRMLLISGADIRCRNDDGWNVLMIAAARGNQKLEVLQLLLQHIDKLGAQQRRIVMQQVNKNGNDSLTEAILGNQERCINLLLISGDSGFSSARVKRALDLAQDQGIKISHSIITLLEVSH